MEMGNMWAVIVDAGLKSAVLCAGGLLVAGGLMRRSSAARRHVVYAGMLVACLLLPVMSLVLPQWRVLPQWPAADVPAPVQSTEAVAPVQTVVPIQEVSVTMVPVVPVGAPMVATPAGPAPQPVQTAWYTRITLQQWLSMAWLAGVLVFVMPILLGQIAMLRIRRSARSCDAAMVSPHCRMPMACGLLRPAVILPEDAQTWSVARRDAVVRHESEHLRRWDCLWQQLGQFARAFYWFNPLIWLVHHRMLCEAERACDDAVLVEGSRPSDYAEHLLAVATTGRSDLLLASAGVAMARSTSLEGRLLSILDAARSRARASNRLMVVVVALLVCVAAPLSMLRGQTPATERSPATGRSTELERYEIGKTLAQFPEQDNLATPETAWAMIVRAVIREDHTTISDLSWPKQPPDEYARILQQAKQANPGQMEEYKRALASSRLLEVWTDKGRLAYTISQLEFAPGQDRGRGGYSVRSFVRDSQQWKNLGESAAKSLEDARSEARRLYTEALTHPETLPRQAADRSAAAATRPAAPTGRLDFRIAPTLRASDDLRIPSQRMGELIRQLAERGPQEITKTSPDLVWVETDTADPSLITGDYQGKHYILFSNSPKHTMLSDGTWGLATVRIIMPDAGGPAVGFDFDQAGAAKFKDLTSSHLKQAVACILDGKAVSAGTIQTPMSAGIISAQGMDLDRARDIAQDLTAGILARGAATTAPAPAAVAPKRLQIAPAEPQAHDTAQADAPLDMVLEKAQAQARAKALQKEADRNRKAGKTAEAAIADKQRQAAEAEAALWDARIKQAATRPAAFRIIFGDGDIILANGKSTTWKELPKVLEANPPGKVPLEMASVSDDIPLHVFRNAQGVLAAIVEKYQRAHLSDTGKASEQEIAAYQKAVKDHPAGDGSGGISLTLKATAPLSNVSVYQLHEDDRPVVKWSIDPDSGAVDYLGIIVVPTERPDMGNLASSKLWQMMNVPDKWAWGVMNIRLATQSAVYGQAWPQDPQVVVWHEPEALETGYYMLSIMGYRGAFRQGEGRQPVTRAFAVLKVGSPTEPVKADYSKLTPEQMQAKVQGWVEDFFSSNYRDITARKTLEWAKAQKLADGNWAIRYKYEAEIWRKDKVVQDKQFVFTPEGGFVSVSDVSAAKPAEATKPATAADRTKADELAKAGWNLWSRGQPGPAVDRFTEAVKLNPNAANSWNGLGWALFNSGRADEALDAFRKCTSLTPNHPAALNGLGQIELVRGDLDMAEKHLLAASSTASAAWWGLAKLYLVQEKYEEAGKWIDRILKQDPTNADAQRLGTAAREKRLPDELRQLRATSQPRQP